MTMDIDQELCKGCGVCVGACPNDAILLQEGKAWINQMKCSSCQLCVEMCPTGALRLERDVIPAIVEKPQAIQVSHPQAAGVALPGRLEWGKTAFALVGQYVLPRLIDILGTYLEQRFSAPVPEQTPMSLNSIINRPYRQRRQRRGRFQSSTKKGGE
jgi:NAD-dependent dihydropyrimidine dehydrogenase PreA subunit